VFSPYKDTSINMNFNTNVMSVRQTGALTPLATEFPTTGAKTVTLAFATGNCGSETWGGISGATIAQANAAALNAAGIKYIVSTGGAGGAFNCASDAGMDTFISRWATPSLIGVDLDIEVGQSAKEVEDIIRTVKTAHAKRPGLRFSLTVATIAASKDGATRASSNGAGAGGSINQTGVGVLDAVKTVFGFNGNPSTWPSFMTVNLMTMDFGPGSSSICVFANGECNMGESAIQAAFNLRDKFGVPLSAVEITPMIGGNDEQRNRFKLNDVDTVAQFAKSQGLAGVHYWSYDRDLDCAPGPASATCNTIGGAGTNGFLKRFLAAGLK
jgi:hypothetical protein